jgi:hypothetical protein
MGILPDEQWRQMRSLPDWQDRLHAAIENFPEAQWLVLTIGITSGALDHWRQRGLLDQPGWWDEMRVRGARAGGWDLVNDQISRSWLKEQMFRWLADNLSIEEAAERSAGELVRLVEFQASYDSDTTLEERARVPETPIEILPSDLEDLLDLEEARRRVEDAAEDDWIPWDQVHAGLR